MRDIIFKPFTYNAIRFEEWQAGKCISSGSIKIKVICEVSNDKVYFSLDGTNDQLNIPDKFDFNVNESTLLPDGRVQYVKAPIADFNPQNPIVCHLFIKNDKIDYVRFAMTNPDRIIEFYNE